MDHFAHTVPIHVPENPYAAPEHDIPKVRHSVQPLAVIPENAYSIEMEPKAVMEDEAMDAGFFRKSFGTESNDQDVLKTAGCTLTWNNIVYTSKVVKATSEKKVILNGVSGYAQPGELIALMGASGAGKTSLLNVLAGRNVHGTVEGQISADGKPRSKDFRKSTAYVEQDDVLYSTLTVRETFHYAALLRLPDTLSKKEKILQAEKTLQQLGLALCADQKIGNFESRGISGGERKRVSIGVELLTNPKILFLDEPTSGLDSFTAFHIVQILKNIAKNGCTIICTIHQPSSSLFDIFDKVLLLSFGLTMYFGKKSDMLTYFEQLPIEKCPSFTNPADYVIELTSLDVRTSELLKKSQQRVEQLNKSFLKSDYGRNMQSFITSTENTILSAQMSKKDLKSFHLNWFSELAILFQRSFLTFVRDKRVSLILVMQTVIMSLLIYAVFAKLDLSQESFMGRNGALFFVLLTQGFQSANVAVAIFLESKAVFLRERASRSYRVSSFYLAKTLADLPVTLMYPTIFCTIVYFGLGFDILLIKYLVFLLTIILSVLCAQSLGYFVSSLAPNFTGAAAMLPPLIILFTLFGGFYTNQDKIWVGLRWVQKVSYIYYAYTVLMNNEYRGLNFECNRQPCLSTGELVLSSYGIKDIPFWKCWVIMAAISVFFRLLAYVVLRFKVKPKISF